MYDVTATGELLIDFTRNGFSKQDNRVYEANPGGAPCNVLAMLGKLGYKTAFIGKVGDDEFGKLLKNTISEQKIDSTDYSLVIAPVVAELCTTSVALSAPPNSYQNNSQS